MQTAGHWLWGLTRAYLRLWHGLVVHGRELLPTAPPVILVGMLIAGTDVPIVPCHLRGCFKALPANARFSRPRRITLRIGEPLRFPDVPNERAGWETIIQQVEGRIRALGDEK